MNNFQIETAQNVSISQNVAGLGSRILAYVIDTLVIVAYVILCVLGIDSLSLTMADQWVYMLIIGLPPFLYYLLLETFWDGKTLGKAALKIKVIKIDGTQARFSDYLIRWLFRIVDISISSGMIALFSIAVSGKGQRLGDIAARTAVISEKQYTSLKDVILIELEKNYQPVYPQVTVFTDKDIRTIKKLYTKAVTRKNLDQELLEKLSLKMQNIMQIELDKATNKQQFITTVLKDYNHYTQEF
ncbi:putative RDD family membrane protein YckC [Mesonia hippocampi]|uniref:Putative RDD family membrane protein YckC n=1 Tax=Mesonia hippocampi TaxID=1628250 RepID=A0A840ELZ3_9FLAO|nr:RDD family protein [Mesonia hippocampi]MBB4119138.1 putative RDD family membrane protein YckC [Mesonia hippocampi]